MLEYIKASLSSGTFLLYLFLSMYLSLAQSSHNQFPEEIRGSSHYRMRS